MQGSGPSKKCKESLTCVSSVAVIVKGFRPSPTTAAESDSDTDTSVGGWSIKGERGGGCGNDWRRIPQIIPQLQSVCRCQGNPTASKDAEKGKPWQPSDATRSHAVHCSNQGKGAVESASIQHVTLRGKEIHGNIETPLSHTPPVTPIRVQVPRKSRSANQSTGAERGIHGNPKTPISTAGGGEKRRVANPVSRNKNRKQLIYEQSMHRI